uniref:Alkyl transferase n=1 Tax=Parthenium argentatum TaxID=35935 RepID=A0A384WD98_PARAR|nr:cis-prenyltransferase 3 [Parthenium argentatum]ATD87117.1 cis-prenyltransferase 3 [synthetic construct]BCU09029.1 cis-prenyltransferase [synthetic construct]
MEVNPIITTDNSLKKMEEERSESMMTKFLGGLNLTARKLLFRVISTGPIPQHIAFIMDGNRRFAKKWKLTEGGGHKAGFLALMSVLKYCYEIGVKYVTVYAFSLDNFNRRPDEVQYVMNLMQEKIEGFLKELTIVNKYGVRVLFIGDLKRLYEPVRIAAEKAMEATAHNTHTYLLVCVAYTSSHEIPRAIYEACEEKSGGTRVMMMNGSVNGDYNNGDYEDHGEGVKVVDIDKHMYMAVAPDPDILVRSSGETRLSNYLLWQTTNCVLYSPKALWPEMGLWQVVWGILKFQKDYKYLEKKKKQA